MAFDESPELTAYLDRLRSALDGETFEAAWAAGRALPQADAVALACSLEPGPG
jgi:hypothetical protein